MKQFFMKVTADYWNPKNKLMDECQQIARDFDRYLIQEPDLDYFLDCFNKEINKSHERNKRCKPLLFYTINEPMGNSEMFLCIDGVFRASVYEVRFFNAEQE